MASEKDEKGKEELADATEHDGTADTQDEGGANENPPQPPPPPPGGGGTIEGGR